MREALVICDKEEAYAKAFATYLLRKRDLPFQVQVCTDPEQVRSIQEKDRIAVLIIHDAFPARIRQELDAEIIFLLTESGDPKKQAREQPLYRLCPAGQILARIMEEWSRRQEGSAGMFWRDGKQKVQVTGIFSPVHRSGRTSYAIQYGKRLASSSHVLYLNLELYGGSGGIFPQEGNTLGDALYYSRQEGKNLGWMLASLVNHMGDLDYLLPVRVSEDVKKVPVNDWKNLIRQISEEGMYDVVVLDIDEGIQDCYELLRICTEIHVPVLSDELAGAKLAQMEEELLLLGYEDVKRRMRKVEVIR